jgi:hypothetical protein
MSEDTAPAIMASIVSQFANAVADRDNAKGSRDRDVFARRYIACFEELVSRFGDRGRDALTALFKHSNESVRCAAAAFLLRYRHEEAVAVLRDLAKGKGITALAAERSIWNWEHGVWELDIDPNSTKV